MARQTLQKVVAVVVTFNRLTQLQKTVQSLLAVSPEHLSALIVFDNASTDGTGAWLDTLQDPRLKLLTQEHNIGGAGGFEAGLRHALKTEQADWFVLMDDDAHPDNGAIEHFCTEKRDAADVWLASVRYPDGAICEMNRPWLNPLWGLRSFWQALVRGRDGFHLSETAYNSNEIQLVDGGSFVGQFISRKAVERAGYPRGELFIYADDVLFTLAVRRAGGRVAFDPALAFVHDCASLDKDSHVLKPLWKVYFYHRNICFVYREVMGPVLFPPLIALKYLMWRRKACHYGSEGDNYIKLVNKAVKDALTGRTGLSASDIQALVTSQAQ